jgi:hypothetical protein
MKEVAKIKKVGDYKKFISSSIDKIKGTFNSAEKLIEFWGLKLTKEQEELLAELLNSLENDIKNAFELIDKSENLLQTRNTIFQDKDYLFSKITTDKITPLSLHFILCLEFCLDAICNLQQKSKIILTNGLKDEEYLKTTNRDGEGLFSIFNRFFEKNPNLNALVAQSVFFIRSVTRGSFSNLKKIVSFYSRQEGQSSEHW